MDALNLLDQRSVFWEFAGLMLAVNQIAVDLHVEDAALTGDHLAINTEVLLNLCRQTGGFGFVVSLHAVFN